MQKLLVCHSPNLKRVVTETERNLSKRAKRVAGVGFETSTSLNRGLHPDSQYAAIPPSKDGLGDGSGDDLTGSGDDVAGSGSGGNGNGGSGGGSTSPNFNLPPYLPQQQGVAGIQKAPSGASNTPLFSWQSSQPPLATGGASWPGMGPAIIEMPQQMSPYGPMCGPDPMMWWYQDYYSKVAGHQDPNAGFQQKGDGVGPSPYKWWRDPKTAFGPPADAHEILAKEKRTRRDGTQQGAEVESAPPSKDAKEEDGDLVAHNLPQRQKRKRLVAPTKHRKNKRKPADPVEEASSGTTGPAHHIDSPEGIMARSPRSNGDANVAKHAKLLLSFSGKGDIFE